MSKILLNIFFLLLIASYGFTEVPLNPLSIRIVSYHNGVGISKDIEILSSELIKLGHDVQYTYYGEQKPIPQVNINLFVEVFNDFYLPLAKENYFIPNPEHCYMDPETVGKFDKVLCKTQEAVRIFSPLNKNTIFISFTSQDKFDRTIEKDYQSLLHLVGASIQKGTKQVVSAWLNNPQYPTLHLIRHRGNFDFPETKNINLMSEYLLDPAIIVFQNSCGVHLSPSETEGFGHSLMEALSCEAILITTDAPPMNEFVTDKRCLAKYTHTEPWRLAIRYYVDAKHLDSVISDILSLSPEEAKEIGKKNREFFLKNDRFFKQKIAEIFSEKGRCPFSDSSLPKG